MTNELRMFLENLVQHPVTVNVVWAILAGTWWFGQKVLWLLLWVFCGGVILGLVRAGAASDSRLFSEDGE